MLIWKNLTSSGSLIRVQRLFSRKQMCGVEYPRKIEHVRQPCHTCTPEPSLLQSLWLGLPVEVFCEFAQVGRSWKPSSQVPCIGRPSVAPFGHDVAVWLSYVVVIRMASGLLARIIHEYA